MKISDKERLDFLELKRNSTHGPYFSRNTVPPEWRLRLYPITYWGTDLRLAIDSAIRASHPKKRAGKGKR